MNVFLSVFIIIVCVLLVLIVLVQNSKGGGLASNFASSNQYMGVRKTADFLEKATWTLAGALLFLCLVSSITIRNKEAAPKSAIEVKDMQPQTTIPTFPVTAPANNKATSTPAPAKTDKNSGAQPVKK